jgi:hypothetical protein
VTDLSGRLIAKARLFCKEHGVCFYCRQDKHLAEDCPETADKKNAADRLSLALKAHGKRSRD